MVQENPLFIQCWKSQSQFRFTKSIQLIQHQKPLLFGRLESTYTNLANRQYGITYISSHK
jgi:hypothetical protein